MEKSEHYTFGDSDVAAERLRLLAQVYAPSSGALLARTAAGSAPELALDLGCGPGYTTRLVAERTRAQHVIGIDQSERLLADARRDADARLTFISGDVTALAAPTPLADFIYSRFLLTHVRDPNAVVSGLSASARPGARLVLEETAILSSTDPLFASYYGFVERMQAHYGQRMYIGLELEALCQCPAWEVESAELLELELPAKHMARLHFLNIMTWARDPFAVASYPEAELARVREHLGRVSSGASSAPPVLSGMKQVVLRRCG